MYIHIYIYIIILYIYIRTHTYIYICLSIYLSMLACRLVVAVFARASWRGRRARRAGRAITTSCWRVWAFVLVGLKLLLKKLSTISIRSNREALTVREFRIVEQTHPKQQNQRNRRKARPHRQTGFSPANRVFHRQTVFSPAKGLGLIIAGEINQIISHL